MADKAAKNAQVFLFYGEESYQISSMVSAVIDRSLSLDEREMNLLMMEMDPPLAELLHLVDSAPFFGERKVVWVKNSKLFQAPRRKSSDTGETEDEEDEAEPSLSKERGKAGAVETDGASDEARLLSLISNMPSYATLIFTATKADKRKKLLKAVAEKGEVHELNPFRAHEDREIRFWVEEYLKKQGKQLQREAMEHLMAVLATMSQVPRGFLASELDKAILYAGAEPAINRKALEEVLAAVPEISAFAMTDALARRNAAQALARLEELLASREPPLKLIGLLAYNVRRWWQVRQIIDRLGTEAEMLSALGAKSGSPFMARRTISQSRSFDSESLKQALLTLADANVAIRSGGDPRPYLERVIIELCQKK